MTYPHELETWWLTHACQTTGCSRHDQALQQLEPAAARLSDQFTVSRPSTFHDYFSDSVSLSAYGNMFFPQTFARTLIILKDYVSQACLIPFENQNRGQVEKFRILDLGCGSGASTLAAALLLNRLSPCLHAVDRAPAALTVLRQAFDDCRALWLDATLETHDRDARTDGLPGAFDLILASFALNEFFPDPYDPQAERWMRQQLDRLAPNGALVVIEPAGAETCGRLQRFRDRLAKTTGFSIVAPCLHPKPCPMLAGLEARASRPQQNPSSVPATNCGFCHDVRTWRVPDSVNLINRRLFRSVHELKYGLLIVRRAAPSAASPIVACRLVAPMHRVKGRFLTHGCCSDGTLRAIELMTRGLSRAQLDALDSRERGDRLRLVNPRLLGDNRTWRVDALEPVEKTEPQNVE